MNKLLSLFYSPSFFSRVFVLVQGPFSVDFAFSHWVRAGSSTQNPEARTQGELGTPNCLQMCVIANCCSLRPCISMTVFRKI